MVLLWTQPSCVGFCPRHQLSIFNFPFGKHNGFGTKCNPNPAGNVPMQMDVPPESEWDTAATAE